MKTKFRYTQSNGNVLAISPLRCSYIITVGEEGKYNSVVIPKQTLIDILLQMTQVTANGNSESIQISA